MQEALLHRKLGKFQQEIFPHCWIVMATASGSPSRKHKLKKQASQSSIATQESSDMTCYIDTDIG